jgi:hypothetical protein
MVWKEEEAEKKKRELWWWWGVIEMGRDATEKRGKRRDHRKLRTTGDNLQGCLASNQTRNTKVWTIMFCWTCRVDDESLNHS